jgi:hypothetical protein
MRFRSAHVGLALSLAAAPAGAQSFTSRAAFDAAAAGHTITTETFDALAPNTILANGTSLGGVTFAAFPIGTSGRIDQTYRHSGAAGLALYDPYDPSLDYFLPHEGVQVTFAVPVIGVGILFNVNPSPSGSYGVMTPNGTAGSGTGCGFFALCFVGFLSPTPFSWAYVGGLSGAAASGFTLDDLVYVVPNAAPTPDVPVVDDVPVPVSTSTPEPGSLALVASGVMALLAPRRRACRVKTV